jgi:hypothetical protein
MNAVKIDHIFDEINAFAQNNIMGGKLLYRGMAAWHKADIVILGEIEPHGLYILFRQPCSGFFLHVWGLRSELRRFPVPREVPTGL